jgi:hypothetical protein
MGVACIGPAGEGRSLIFCIINDKGHAAGQCGFIAVMGIKRLKALLALANHRVPIAETDLQPSRRIWPQVFPFAGTTGYPPHKHDKDKLPVESANEEVYLIKVDPPEGFGFATVYDRGILNEAYRVTNNSVVSIPYGYHPMVSAPGHKFGFIWFMAAERRPWKPQTDPDHAWAQHLGLKMI